MKKELSGREAMLDSAVKDRNRLSRATFGVLVCLIITMIIILIITSVFGASSFFIGIGLSLIAIGSLVKLLTTYVPYTWGLVAQNMLSGEPVVYGSGWHWSYPWERVTEADNISLEERTSIREDLTMASRTDELKLKMSFQWRPNLKRLAVYRRMDSSTIENGFFEPFERFVSTLISLMSAEEARNNQSVMSSLARVAFKGYNEAEAKEAVKTVKENSLRDRMLEELQLFRQQAESLEYHFGITVVQVNISDIDFSEDVRSARAARAEHDAIRQIYYDLAGGEDAYKAASAQEKEQYRAEARVLSKNATEKQLNIRGNPGNNRFMINEGE